MKKSLFTICGLSSSSGNLQLLSIRNCTLYIVLCTLYFFLSSCNPTKKLGAGELLLDKNIITDRSQGQVDKSDIEPYIKQKPNRRTVLFRFYLYLYNSVNQQKMEKRKAKRNARYDRIDSLRIEKNNLKNQKRIAKGKESKNANLKNKDRLTRREYILSIGEPPVIYDSALTKKSAKQINQFLNNKGFFNSSVKDSVSVKHKKARVHYTLHTGKPYLFNTLSYEIKDDILKYYVLSDTSSTLIHRGKNYDVEMLQKERDRITMMLRNEGYYQFSKEYIYFEIDSSLGTHEVNVTLGIKNPVIKVEGEKDSTVETAHIRFYINNIYVYTDYDPKSTAPKDTLFLNDYKLISTGMLRYKPRLFNDALFISKGELFQQSHTDQTFGRFSELKLFRSIQIKFVNTEKEKSKLDCYIYLSNIPKLSVAAETEGTNTSGTLGIAGDIVYQDKNTFKGGEIFEVKLKGALEVQKTNTVERSQILNKIPFNTLELGSQVNFYIPHFVTPFRISGTQSNDAKTRLTASYDFQERPDYTRSIINTAFGYSWKETKTKQHTINPIQLSLVNINITDSNLQKTINQPGDLFLKNSYNKHFTLGSSYSFVFSNQNIRKQKDFVYFRYGLQGAGNAMRGVFSLLDQPPHKLDTIRQQDGEKSYTVSGNKIPFSQYVRSDFDFRYYRILTEKAKIVYRCTMGVGKPLNNLRELPLEASFYAGGPNDIRAWQARTLGPGGYEDKTNSNYADKIGDIKIEANVEYRFHIIKLLNGAMFVDAGNIWLRKPYTSYPGGEITIANGNLIPVDNLLGEFAIGAGVGLRMDFNFFIIRLDWACKVKDPAYPENDRWMFGKPLQTVLNFGIGYPF